MKKTFLAVLAATLLLFTSCQLGIDPSLPDAMVGSSWENSFLGTGSALNFEAAPNGNFQILVGGDAGSPSDFTYSYDPTTQSGTIEGISTFSLGGIVVKDGEDETTFTIVGTNILKFRGHEYKCTTGKLF